MKIGAPPAQTRAAGSMGTGTVASGDLGGTYPSPTVEAIGAIPVNTTNAADGLALVYDIATRTIVFGELGASSSSGHWETTMQPGVTAPPVPVENEARDDWLWAFVSD